MRLFQRHSCRGFNLLETVLAVLLFAMVVVFMVGLWAHYARANEKSRNHLVASHLGERALEENLALGYHGVQSDGPIPIQMEVTSGDVVTNIDYELNITVTQVETGLKSVLVTVQYPFKEDTREVRFESLLFESN